MSGTAQFRGIELEFGTVERACVQPNDIANRACVEALIGGGGISYRAISVGEHLPLYDEHLLVKVISLLYFHLRIKNIFLAALGLAVHWHKQKMRLEKEIEEFRKE